MSDPFKATTVDFVSSNSAIHCYYITPLIRATARYPFSLLRLAPYTTYSMKGYISGSTLQFLGVYPLHD